MNYLLKVGIITIIVILSIPVIYYIGYTIVYAIRIGQANEKGRIEWCKHEMLNSFEGKISDINRYEYDNYMNTTVFGVDIKTFSDSVKYIHYQFEIKKSRDLLEFVKVGQKAFKKKDSKFFELESETGEKKEFLIPNCD